MEGREGGRERGREGSSQARRGREGYHNITNHRRRDVSIQPLTLALARAFEPSSRHPRVSSRLIPPPGLQPRLTSRRDSRTRYLSYPRAQFARTVASGNCRVIYPNPSLLSLSLSFVPVLSTISSIGAAATIASSSFSPSSSSSCSSTRDPTASGSSSSFLLPHALSRPPPSVHRVYDPVENVRPHPRHDLALVSTPNGSRRSTRILA